MQLRHLSNDVAEVKLPRPWLMAAGNVCNMNRCDQINILLQPGDQVSFRNLRVVADSDDVNGPFRRDVNKVGA